MALKTLPLNLSFNSVKYDLEMITSVTYVNNKYMHIQEYIKNLLENARKNPLQGLVLNFVLSLIYYLTVKNTEPMSYRNVNFTVELGQVSGLLFLIWPGSPSPTTTPTVGIFKSSCLSTRRDPRCTQRVKRPRHT